MKNRTELLMILATAVVLVMFVIYDKYSEGFANENRPRPPVTSCPDLIRNKTIAYYDKKDVMCCDGKVTNNKCDSKPICTLGKPSGEVKSCADISAKTYQEISDFICPSNLPNFYFNRENGDSGCTDSPLKPNYKGPASSSANKCKIYITLDNQNVSLSQDNYLQQDACVIKKETEALQKQCIGSDCAPFSRPIQSQNISLLGLEFTDIDGVRRTCYDDRIYSSYIQKIKPGANISQSPYKEQLCSNAKALYIDKGK